MLMQYPFRCVADEQRTFALGIQSTIFRIFGNVPGPIVFGVVFDAACKFRNYEFSCESTTTVQGACWEHDRGLLSDAILAMVVVAFGLNFIFSFLAWLAYPKSKKLSKDPVMAVNKLEMKDASTAHDHADSTDVNGVEELDHREM